MQNVFFVTTTQFDTARAMEKRLLDLPAASGILFVGVSVHQNRDERRENPEYHVVLGCSRERELDLMHAVAKQYLRDYVDDEQQLVVQAFRGVSHKE